jgi:hypothetical protein
MKAFPSNGFYQKTIGGEQPQKLEPIMGMDLRDYFAAQAVQALIPTGIENNLGVEFLAKDAYKIADAMMKAREQ